GELFCGQAQLGGMVATVDPAFASLPTARHEAACASGSVAALAGMADLEAGRYDCALVVGVELMRNVGAQEAAEHLGSAAWAGREALDARFPWPALFSEIADAYAERYGLDYPHLARIAEVTFANARRNPNAQARTWTFGSNSFAEDDDLDAVETHDCFTITEYAALDHFGITPPGQSWRAVEEGVIEPDGKLPVNPSGGLIGLGHPVGATGVRMLLDAAKQVTGGAGSYQ